MSDASAQAPAPASTSGAAATVIPTPILFLHVLVVAACGLVYELMAGTLASYVLGDSVTQFSLIIGLYLSALGVGAWLSRRITTRLAQRFVDVELAVALLGGGSAPLLFLSFSRAGWFHPILYGIVFAVGTLVGLELPLLMRILKGRLAFEELVAKALSFDYVGALLASVAFPLVLVPRLGLVRTSLVFGLLNAGVGLWATWLLRPLLDEEGGGVRALRVRAVLVMALLAAGVAGADALTSLSEDNLYADDVVYSRNTPYQRIVITRGRAGFQLFLNGNLQFSSADEYRYHEALVHPAMALRAGARRVLVLGGGDGLAVREILRHASVERVTLVDLDPDMTKLGERFPPLGVLAKHSLRDPRVEVINRDAMIWLEETSEGGESARGEDGKAPSGGAVAPPYDAAIIDFPDPNNFALGKLYTTRFYRLLLRRLAPDGVVAVQSTSPLFARSSYWCVVRTMEAAGLHVRPYHATVPAFGVWGYALGRRAPFEPPAHAPPGLRFLDDATLAALFRFPPDMAPVPVEVNRLDNQVLVRYYESEWKRWD